jgi:diguanylate cyclase (GGDEF)-like protein
MTNRSPPAWLRLLTEPKASIPESERRRARLLAWIQLALLALAAVALPVVFIFGPAGGPARSRYDALVAAAIVVLAAAYAINRAGRYFASAWLTIAVTVVGPWAAVALEGSTLGGNIVPLTYTVMPVFLAGILLSAPATALLAVVQVTILILLQFLYPASATTYWPSLVTFVLFLSVLSVVAAVVIRQDQRQIDRQSHLLIESEARLREQSVRDVLTGLFNRRYLEETLDRELGRAKRAQGPLGVMMIDIDHFKRFNDAYGHATGDALLRELGALLRANVRGSDIACRYGGEEFILLLPDSSRDVTRERAERIRENAGRISVRHEGRAIEFGHPLDWHGRLPGRRRHGRGAAQVRRRCALLRQARGPRPGSAVELSNCEPGRMRRRL